MLEKYFFLELQKCRVRKSLSVVFAIFELKQLLSSKYPGIVGAPFLFLQIICRKNNRCHFSQKLIMGGDDGWKAAAVWQVTWRDVGT